jgi:hypothetical protein
MGEIRSNVFIDKDFLYLNGGDEQFTNSKN